MGGDRKLPLEIDALSLLSEALNFDFARKGMDEAFTDAEMAEMSGCRRSATASCANGKKNPTVREFIHFSGRGRVHNPIVGGPRRSPIGSSNGSSSAPATASSCRRPTCRRL